MMIGQRDLSGARSALPAQALRDRNVTRLLVADDHLLFRAAVKRLLSDESDFVVVAEAGNDAEVLACVRRQVVNVIILDLSMSGRDGFELIARLKSLNAKLPVLILTAHTQTEYCFRALRAGADGYLTKFDTTDQLVTAVRKVAAGGRYICAKMAEGLAFEVSLGETTEQPHTKLTDREYKVFELLIVGKTVSQIARDLFLSFKTVSTYKTRMLHKMALRNQAELIRYAINNNLMPD